MRLLVLGASGRTGRLVVEQGLGHGHDVTAFVRDPSKLGMPRERLHVVAGDVLDPAALGTALVGQDSVVSAIGASSSGEVHVYSDGTANLIRAMTIGGIRRLVVLSSAGVGATPGTLPVRYRLFMSGLGMRPVFEDMERMEGDVMLSDLDWTIVRPARLTDGTQTGRYRTVEGSVVPKGSEISRADVAALLLKCAETDLYARKAVAAAY